MARWKRKNEENGTIIWDYVEKRDGKEMNTGNRIILSKYYYSPVDKWQIHGFKAGYSTESYQYFAPTKEQVLAKVPEIKRLIMDESKKDIKYISTKEYYDVMQPKYGVKIVR